MQRSVSYFFCLLISGNDGDRSTWCGSSAVLCVWCHLHHPAVHHLIPNLSFRLLHWCVSSTTGYRHHCHSGIHPQYPFAQVSLRKSLCSGLLYLPWIKGELPHFSNLGLLSLSVGANNLAQFCFLKNFIQHGD